MGSIVRSTGYMVLHRPVEPARLGTKRRTDLRTSNIEQGSSEDGVPPKPPSGGSVRGRPQVASNETVSEYLHLFRFDASGFDDTRGAFTLALHEARELGLRHGHWIGPVFHEPVAQFWCRQDTCDVFR